MKTYLKRCGNSLEEMDKKIFEVAEEAVRCNRQKAFGRDPNTENFPITAANLPSIRRLGLEYIDSDYTPEAAVQYVLRLPEVWSHWRGLSVVF